METQSFQLNLKHENLSIVMSVQLSYTFNIIYSLQPIKLNTQLLYYYASLGSVSLFQLGPKWIWVEYSTYM